MTSNLLERAAAGDVDYGRLSDLAAECFDQTLLTGDARYALLRDLFREVDDGWNDEYGGITGPRADDLKNDMSASLRTILDAETPAQFATTLVADLALRIRQLL